MLSEISKKTITSTDLPVNALLENSLYYPSSGLDVDVAESIDFAADSYIHVDYGIRRQDLINAVVGTEHHYLKHFGKVIAHRPVNESELVPQGWRPNWNPTDGNPSQFMHHIAKPFCEWIVFERSDGRRISLLHLCADGVAAYQALYIANKTHPKWVAIVQPGHIHGNWTNYTLMNTIFHRTVVSNKFGLPTYLLNGGYYQLKGDRFLHQQPIWSEYENFLGFSRRRQYVDLYRGGIYRGRISKWEVNEPGNLLNLINYSSEWSRTVLANNKSNPKIRVWHNFWSLVIQPRSVNSRTPNPIYFDNCAGAKQIDRSMIFKWHLHWLERHDLKSVASKYFENLSASDWEYL